MDTYRAELLEQPAALAATAEALAAATPLFDDLVARVERDRLEHVILTGMGASLFALQPLALRLAAAGRPVTLLETAELLHTCPGLVTPRALLVAVSQSGETVEVVRLLDVVGGRAPLVAVTNGRDNTLARSADYRLTTLAGAERSVSNKSYVTCLLALDALSRALTGQPLNSEAWAAPIEAVRDLLAGWPAVEAALSAVAQCRPLYLLGRGPSIASALTGGLIIKEAARHPAEGMSAAQFRHGPLEMIAPGMGVLLFVATGPTRPLGLRLAGELAGYGVTTAVVGPLADEPPPAVVAHVPLPPLDPWLAPVAEIVPVQILIQRLALNAGLEPGRFERLGKVATTE